MITNEWMSPTADEVGERYEILVRAWSQIFAQASAARDLGSARSFSRVKAEAYRLAQTHLDFERLKLAEILIEAAHAAQEATREAIGASDAGQLPDAVSEAVSGVSEHLAHELAVQVERDIAFLVRSLRQHALQLAIAARAKRISIDAAAMQARIGAPGILNFTMHDRSGSRWPSRRFVRSLARHALLTTYNDVVLLTLAEHGLERAEIRHLNPRAEVNGLVVGVSPDGADPTYAEIRNDVFHPNAEAVLVPYGASR